MTAPLPPTSAGSPNDPRVNLALYEAQQAEMAAAVKPELPPEPLPRVEGNAGQIQT
jgi:hypothetical protein